MKLAHKNKSTSCTFLIFKDEDTQVEVHVKVPHAVQQIADHFVEGEDYEVPFLEHKPAEEPQTQTNE